MLNPQGVRIGTAEIYRVVEQFDEVVDSLVVGLEDGDDVAIVLFVVLRTGVELDRKLVERCREQSPLRAVLARVAARLAPERVGARLGLPTTF